MLIASSVVVGHFDFVGIIVLPAEADSPLVINGNGVLADTVPFEGVQTVARWHLEIVDRSGQVNKFQSAHGSGKEIRWQMLRVPGCVKELGLLIGECLDHEIAQRVTWRVSRIRGGGHERPVLAGQAVIIVGRLHKKVVLIGITRVNDRSCHLYWEKEKLTGGDKQGISQQRAPRPFQVVGLFVVSHIKFWSG